MVNGWSNWGLNDKGLFDKRTKWSMAKLVKWPNARGRNGEGRNGRGRSEHKPICLEYVEIIIASSDKSSKFNSFASTLVVLRFHAFSGTNFSLMNEGNIFREFYFPIRTSIRENKNLAKISTYTVCHDVFLMHLHQNAGMHFKTCYSITSILEAGKSFIS